MMRVHARDLLIFQPAELEEVLTGRFILVFDDGEIETNVRETMYSAYSWLFHKLYPATPLLTSHFVTTALKGKRLSTQTHLTLLGNAMWSVHDAYLNNGEEVDRDHLAQLVYQITNQMYNELTQRSEPYVTSLDITDFMEVMAEPTIAAAKANLQPTEASIAETYEIALKTIKTSPTLAHNPLSKIVRSGLANDNQVLQCVIARGFVTDTDSHQFRHPILRGFAEGLRLFHDIFIESRSASKALVFSKTPLQEAEYFSRRLQLVCQIVKNLHRGDCGTNSYFYFPVRDEIRDDLGHVEFEGDLKRIIGKYYLDEKDNRLKSIKITDTHLIGKTLKMRSVRHCAHPDPYGVCEICFGEMGAQVPDGTNLGHMCCTSMTQKSSQSVLSVKHLDGSAAIEGIRIEDWQRPYLATTADGMSYILSPKLAGKPIKLVIPAAAATGITDVMTVDRVENLNITRVSELKDIGLIIGHSNELVEEISIPVRLGRRLSSMTYPLLRQIREKNFEVDRAGNFVVDMEGWKMNQPILTLPMKHFNMSDHSKEIANILESSVKEMVKRDKEISPDSFTIEVHDVINSRLDVNLAVTEVVVLGAMIQSAEEHNYFLPKPWTQSGLGVMEKTMDYRSLSANMAYEGHLDVFLDPMSYLLKTRPDHPFDLLLEPSLIYEKDYIAM